jgi:hypothetical protein
MIVAQVGGRFVGVPSERLRELREQEYGCLLSLTYTFLSLIQLFLPSRDGYELLMHESGLGSRSVTWGMRSERTTLPTTEANRLIRDEAQPLTPARAYAR